VVVLVTLDVEVTEIHHHLVDTVVLLKVSVPTVHNSMLEGMVVMDQVDH
jgi:hypothetical protein